ncbi:MAG: DegV family protein [Lachnospiraceae bacterium]|nr:DegV family protein [Lachnospiraceae bacterium]
MNFKLATDNTTDLPLSYIKENNIGLMTLSCLLDGVTYDENNILDSKVFFEKMRNGSMPTTSQVNPDQAKSHFESYIKEGYKEILYLAFSSGLSGTYSSVKVAAEEIMEEHPDVKIEVIDTLCAAMGEGLLVYLAVEEMKRGKSFQEVVEFVKETIPHVIHVFTVDDLNHLHRGGRVSKATAVIGTLANIKPILRVDDEGHLVSLTKTRGRKKSLMTLVNLMEEYMGSYKDKNGIFMINHGDCEEDARFLADAITNRLGIEECMINPLGAVIGSHTGPGLIALFFLGDAR